MVVVVLRERDGGLVVGEESGGPRGGAIELGDKASIRLRSQRASFIPCAASTKSDKERMWSVTCTVRPQR
jgi:hypothetical protein